MERSLSLIDQTEKPAPKVGTCGSCRHSHFGAQPPFGEGLHCRRNPPTCCILPGAQPGQLHSMGMFPNVAEGARCGEYLGGRPKS